VALLREQAGRGREQGPVFEASSGCRRVYAGSIFLMVEPLLPRAEVFSKLVSLSSVFGFTI